MWCDGCDGKTPSMASKVWEQTLTQDRTVLLKPDARFPPDFFSFVFLLGRSASEPLGDFFFPGTSARDPIFPNASRLLPFSEETRLHNTAAQHSLNTSLIQSARENCVEGTLAVCCN